PKNDGHPAIERYLLIQPEPDPKQPGAMPADQARQQKPGHQRVSYRGSQERGEACELQPVSYGRGAAADADQFLRRELLAATFAKEASFERGSDGAHGGL